MYSKSKTVEFVSKILSDEGFQVKRDFKIGRFYADILCVKEDKAILVEVKSGRFKLDQSDLMQVAGYIGALRGTRRFGNMKISGLVVASAGTITPASPLTSDLGIHVIDSDKEEIIEKRIKEWTREL